MPATASGGGITLPGLLVTAASYLVGINSSGYLNAVAAGVSKTQTWLDGDGVTTHSMTTVDGVVTAIS